jgi:hypothetical protein
MDVNTFILSKRFNLVFSGAGDNQPERGFQGTGLTSL